MVFRLLWSARAETNYHNDAFGKVCEVFCRGKGGELFRASLGSTNAHFSSFFDVFDVPPLLIHCKGSLSSRSLCHRSDYRNPGSLLESPRLSDSCELNGTKMSLWVSDYGDSDFIDQFAYRNPIIKITIHQIALFRSLETSLTG